MINIQVGCLPGRGGKRRSNMNKLTDEIYTTIGKFIVNYERVQIGMKYIIAVNSIIPNYIIRDERGISASQVLRELKIYVKTNYSSDLSNYNNQFEGLLNKINELNKFRNNILHGLVSKSLTENRELAMIFLNHELFKDHEINAITNKISLEQLKEICRDANSIYHALVKINENKILNKHLNIFSNIMFDEIDKCNFKI